MKTVSILALVAALGLSVSGTAFAQDVGVTVDGAVDAEVDVDAGGDDAGVGVDVDADADADADVDAPGDDAGDDDAAGGDDAAGADGDDAAEMDDDMSSDDCAEFDVATMLSSIGEDQLAAIASATTVSVAVLTECDTDTEAQSALVDLEAALFANAAISAELTRVGVTSGDVIGASVEGDVVTVYASDDEE